ncbi:uncharacterized protein AB675_10147 [Cyphellophora attinorum]|uniref:Glyoxalase-like domain-containing protein n=1 Tax=Cyphellophora attinorum TaxID=1664694 RepID=A0A0N1H375_9EURO|nr:uncharacterized protein AB675_10147 [Phialophora attinorum]KPI35205.1 hypothetical protein AB675_10147 [Phialophora attinorum]
MSPYGSKPRQQSELATLLLNDRHGHLPTNNPPPNPPPPNRPRLPGPAQSPPPPHHHLRRPSSLRRPSVGQWGLENFLVSIGGDIIEVVAPSKPGTTAGRLLERRGEGGYMIIMQTGDAEARRKEVEAAGGPKVIFGHEFSHQYESWDGEKDEGWCIQYHPKGTKGGMMPELDSHAVCERNSDPLGERFSPWHACGKEYERYVELMEESGELHLLGCTLRLAEGDGDVGGAARQWSDLFGIPLSRGELAFTNARVGFVKGQEKRSEGLTLITIGVGSENRLSGILNRAREEGLWRAADGSFLMLGIMWKVVLLDGYIKARL